MLIAKKTYRNKLVLIVLLSWRLYLDAHLWAFEVSNQLLLDTLYIHQQIICYDILYTLYYFIILVKLELKVKIVKITAKVCSQYFTSQNYVQKIGNKGQNYVPEIFSKTLLTNLDVTF